MLMPKARLLRNHLACCYHALFSLKVKAQILNKSLYAVQKIYSAIICVLSFAHHVSQISAYAKANVLTLQKQGDFRIIFGTGFNLYLTLSFAMFG